MIKGIKTWMMWMYITQQPKYTPIPNMKGMTKMTWEIIITSEKMGWCWNVHKYNNIYNPKTKTKTKQPTN
jgi:hypothetical protein